MKTESEKIEISKQAAEIVGRPAFESVPFHVLDSVESPILGYNKKWLVDDHGACAEIAADRDLDIIRFPDGVMIRGEVLTYAHYHDFPSRIEATNWAICEAVIKQDKENGK